MPAPVLHHRALGIHPAAFISPTPPDTSDIQDHCLWVDTSTGPPFALKSWFATDIVLAYAATVLADNPLGYWRLGEAVGSSTVADSSGAGRTGTLVGGVTLGQAASLFGDANTCALFNGTTGRITIADASGLPTTGAYTIEAVAKRLGNAGGGFGTLLCYGNGATNRLNGLLINDTNTAPFINWWANDYSVNQSGITGVWHHFAATWDGTNRKIYVDGVLIGSQASSGFNAVQSNLGIGCRRADNNLFFNGYLDEVAIHNTALSAARLMARQDSMRYGPQNGLWRVLGTGGPAGPAGIAGPTGATGATGAVGPGVEMYGECLIWSNAGEICNPSTNRMVIQTPDAAFEFTPNRFILPGGHYLETV